MNKPTILQESDGSPPKLFIFNLLKYSFDGLRAKIFF